MDLPRSTVLVPRLEVLETAGSTNAELVERASGADAASWPDLSVIVTDHQTAGRGRLGRSWTAPAGTSLAISVLLRPGLPREGREPEGFVAVPAAPALGYCPPVPIASPDAADELVHDSLGWIPLLAGLATTRAVRSLGAPATLKWPNDVLIGAKKVSGILSELLPAAAGVVVGVGLNLSIPADELPVDTATSLLVAGVSVEADAALVAFLTEFTGVYRAFVAAGGDVQASGLRAAVVEACDTLGRSVRVQLPAGEPLLGTAVDIDTSGRLVVEANGRRTAVAAGDVTHLRY
jgi:BirA family biotin operon repressor/biotin-[acetyl-CoA-carboxylase] ligase